MMEPLWLSVETIQDIHAEQLVIYGGPEGIRDQGLLESAVARPINRFAYGETDLAALAAAYAFGLARNHPFVDGNKRAAFLAMMTFLRFNGVAFAPTQPMAAAAILALAAGEVDEDGLTRWIRDNWPKDAPA
ncbi:type II toxin-antitoxin system death-on-curing family toxin [Bosea sp. (in: a-proteobacteria)]|uniref:type II toxin-antitoxin system death-on-curing family toxin n=1 Tax=Bosea sp. (in: a-proteobacteria) TaxID=1871050 RepID=UPI00273250A8|nr:type II toxin-antitoxin system death-on-curing family toxin [Bosea sp. (in: a-proteobacteria)]MDP3411304.1 type II toxin-antitoxin system death-on-curing family toxin [Bosea sp. (in: a-proteobacteria)]